MSKEIFENLALTVLEPIAIATVLGNWHNVLRAINMASGTISARCITFHMPSTNSDITAKISKPRTEDDDETGAKHESVPLPQTLVRIPTEHAPALQAQAEGALEAEQNSSAIS